MQKEEGAEQPCLPPEIEAGTVDAVVLIFVLSALHPREWAAAARNVHSMLKPGGKVLFRDYGRYDMPQLRFKKNRMLEDNFYGEPCTEKALSWY
jgi:tRNAThr (cytosine32-N3)-methyltransferase